MYKIADDAEVPLDDCENDPCALRGGQDRLRVEVTLVKAISAGKSVNKPSLSLFADGVALEGGASFQQTSVSPRRFTSGSYLAPAKRIDHLSLRVLVADGYETTVDDLQVTAAQPTLNADCVADAGSVRGVGHAQVVLSAWVAAGTKATLHSSSAAPDIMGSETSFVAHEGDLSTATWLVPTPERGSTWKFWAQTPGLPDSKPVQCSLRAPEIVLSANGCEQQCSAEAGASLTLAATAPEDLLQRAGIVRMTVDGVAIPAEMPLSFDWVQDGKLQGVTVVTVPERGKHAVYRLTIAGFTTKGTNVDITPAKDAGTAAQDASM